MFCIAASGDAQTKGKPKAAEPGHDCVFLAEARPLLIRVHVRIDGKTLTEAGDDFMAHLFRHLDVKRKGYLTNAEVERGPLLNHMMMGGLSSPFGGFGMGAKDNTPKMQEMDTDKDGKVTLAELSAYYRKKGFTPFQFKTENEGQNAGMMMAMETGVQPEPSVDEVSDAIFALLDAKKANKLTKADLAKAPERLLRLDGNEDEMVTARELAPNAKGKSRAISEVWTEMEDVESTPPAPTPDKKEKEKKTEKGKSAPKIEDIEAAPPTATRDKKEIEEKKAMKEKGKSMVPRPPTIKSLNTNQRVFLIASPGEAPADFATSMQQRYGAKNAKVLSRADLGLDEATFAALDTNRDGFLDAKELAGFVKRTPDLEITIHLGAPGDAKRGVELVRQKGKPGPLAGNVKAIDGLAMLDFPKTRVELRGHDETAVDTFAAIMRAQYSVIFKQFDKNNDGYVDAEESKNTMFGDILGNSFHAMDADGDGRVTEKEFNAYLDFLEDAKARLNKACVSLAFSDESRGLFDLLDVNRDGRLSMREMRGAAALLEKLDRAGKGYVTRDDVPKSYRLTVRRGPATNNGDDYSALLSSIYGGPGKTETYKTPTAGPLWFRKMDKNRDGDVSRREWLGSEAIFRQIDSDGDGLISAEEAEHFDALHRKQK